LNPGAETNPTCKIDELGLSADYEKRGDDYVFNFQHVLFLMKSAQQTGVSTFRLECSVEVCEKNNASSKCNSAAAVCVDASTDDLTERVDGKKRYMCDNLCENNDECSIEGDIPSCKVCTCEHGIAPIGADCSAHATEVCLSCESGFTLASGVCSSTTVSRNLGDETFLFADASDSISCGFQLVRRNVNPDNWHPAKDHLEGTDTYGTFVDDISIDQTFSRIWKGMNFDEFLFSDTAFDNWMIMNRDAVGGPAGFTVQLSYGDALRWIEKSSVNNNRYQAIQQHNYYVGQRSYLPWLSYGGTILNGNTLYGGGGHGHLSRIRRQSNGMNVFIRNSPNCA